MKILPTDLISGALYLQLVEEYKEYDKKQKKVIHQLMSDVDSLSRKLHVLTTTEKLGEKVAHQAGVIHSMAVALTKQKREYQKLLEQHIKLQKSIKNEQAEKKGPC